MIIHRMLPLALLAAVSCNFALVQKSIAQDSAATQLQKNPFWHDGKAEISSYTLEYPRYGEKRTGTAVAIFVTEPISRATRIKIERPGHDPADMLQVMKLNLVKDFQTGVYDYNLMTSVFLALQPFDDRKAGSVAKVSFSAQEWCGQAYQQVLFRANGVEDSWHSYFQAEGDGKQLLPAENAGLSEDALLLWARGWAEPVLNSGESRQAKVLRSLEHSRLRHVPVSWLDATLSRGAELIDVKTAHENIKCRVLSVVIKKQSPAGSKANADSAGADLTWTIYVEDAAPNRVVQWETSDGERAILNKSARMPYWQLQSNADESKLKELDLKPVGN